MATQGTGQADPYPVATPAEPEWLTRKQRIDPALDALGWRLARGNGARPAACRSEEEVTANGPADYALWLDDRVVGRRYAAVVGRINRPWCSAPTCASGL